MRSRSTPAPTTWPPGSRIAPPERHDKLAAHGILPLHFPPKRIKIDPSGIIRDITQAIEKGLQRPPLPVTALPLAA